MTTDLKALVTGLYDLLEPAEPAERKKAIKAALTMLGDDTSVANENAEKGEPSGEDEGDFNAKTRSWMTRNNVTTEQLNHVFHIDGETVDIIADSAPGKNQKEQAINAYVLTGIAELLKTGEAKFDDKSGRAACKKMGCYGDTNHATYLKKPGNILSGSKESGWTLTGPGQKAGAELVKQITAE